VKKHALTPAMEANKWKKGQPSANPSGRPKSKPLTDRYNLDLEAPIPDKLRRRLLLPKEAVMADAIVRTMIGQAITGPGRVEAAREITDRVEGKPPVAVSMKHAGGVKLNVVYQEGRKGGLGDDDFGTTS